MSVEIRKYKGKEIPELENHYLIVRKEDDIILGNIYFEGNLIEKMEISGCQISDLLDVCIHQLSSNNEKLLDCLKQLREI